MVLLLSLWNYRIDQQRYWDDAIKFARWQHLAIAQGARSAVPKPHGVTRAIMIQLSEQAAVLCLNWSTVNSATAVQLGLSVTVTTWRNINNLTLEQPGVKAPGTAKITPFLLPTSSARFTLLAGDPSYRGVVGSLSPTYESCTKSLCNNRAMVNSFMISLLLVSNRYIISILLLYTVIMDLRKNWC